MNVGITTSDGPDTQSPSDAQASEYRAFLIQAIEARTFPRAEDVAERVWRGSGQGWPR